ncbi:helix-turn-helix transcriptional regulator [Catenuloplanes atrovinosus]|uniref:Transcriptional regulator with XRE-family HTH domain n=1 Tax=Catenuloplanes atrovinosus TaxID=137266 RepID=A0AAE3YMS7_9ACTN|nr:helix-turn-helix transcriptional regulator [Catenuloplanes atrovinosus]MDR7275221.1 transcriptional regulator with XRE-family HTH domain [Catenuloplanes atrovinosus]
MSDTLDTSRELGAFLRSRRERLDPRDAGLPERRRSRRTPGLRREEVAELAGISIDYVVRLEQARGLRPSAEVLEALSRALRLAPDERAYLFDLARHRSRPAGEPATAAAPPLARLVADLSPLPAMVINHRFDILTWNPEMARLQLDFDTRLPPARHNSAWLCLMRPEMRDYYLDRDRVVHEAVAHVRAAWAAHPEDRALAGLIAEFSTDEQFARVWAQGEVRSNGRGSKAVRHPGAGTFAVDFETLTPLGDRDQRLVICRPADDDSRAALHRLTASPAG